VEKPSGLLFPALSMPGLTLQNLRFSHPGSSFALQVKDLRVGAGSSFALLGPSGAGKTTLLRLMAGLLKPESGDVRLDETSLQSLSEAERRAFRLTQIGMVFQDFALLDYLTVEENILLPHRFHALGENREALADHARTLADQLGIERHWQQLAGHLSQGERQRVAIIRALAHRPRFLFADEPTASLDATRRGQVMELLNRYTSEQQATFILVTHDTDLIPLFPDHARVEDFTA
jgi:putative ABC transport system ATP-binding protein